MSLNCIIYVFSLISIFLLYQKFGKTCSSLLIEESLEVKTFWDQTPGFQSQFYYFIFIDLELHFWGL